MALVGMRLSAYLKAQYAIAPSLAGLGVLAALYGGGVARPEEAYGVSALVLFPVLAWQVKILLDAEPDVQRRLARVAVGSAGREIGAGLGAAALSAVPTVVAALVLPWVFGGGAVLAVVLGLTASPVPWLAPPLMSVARFGARDPSLIPALEITGWAAAWTSAAVAG